MKTFKCLVRFCGLAGREWGNISAVIYFHCHWMVLALHIDWKNDVQEFLKRENVILLFSTFENYHGLFLKSRCFTNLQMVSWFFFSFLFVHILFLYFNSQEWTIQQIFNTNENGNIPSVSQCLVCVLKAGSSVLHR